MNAGEENFARRAWALLREGPFRRYIIGSAISDTGIWMQVMAQGWVMSSLTDRGFYLGLAAAAAGVPTILLAMKGGEAADRYDKRKILIWTQVAQIALALILGGIRSSRAKKRNRGSRRRSRDEDLPPAESDGTDSEVEASDGPAGEDDADHVLIGAGTRAD